MGLHLPVVFAFGIIVGFLVCLGIGANDLANSFGTAYGAKVLSFKQIIVIAGIMELAGASLLGAEVSKTIRKGIASTDQFESDPDQFMYGMLCALISTAAWLALATWKRLPVSTTHSIIGGIIGFALVFGGFTHGVNWATPSDKFPFVKGVSPVFISWLASPLLAAIIGAGTFFLLRLIVLRSDPSKSVLRTAIFFAVIAYITMFINVFFLFKKGLKHRLKWTDTQRAWVTALIAIPFAVIAAVVVLVLARHAKQQAAKDEIAEKEAEERRKQYVKEADIEEDFDSPTQQLYQRYLGARKAILLNEQGDHDMLIADEDENILSPEVNKGFSIESFPAETERLFRFLQIATSCMVAFAHGSNDVSNGVGAVAGIYGVSSNDGKLGSKSDVPWWLLVGGGVGIVIGLALFGKTIMEVLGSELVKLTASRGFVAEFAAATTVILASFIGLPVSTTHCITGGVVGVGIVESWKRGVAWAAVGRIAVGWVATVVLTACTSALIYLPFFYKG